MKDDKKWQGRRVNKEIEEYMIKFGAKVFTDEGGMRDGPRTSPSSAKKRRHLIKQ
jgi:hypothetical protein